MGALGGPGLFDSRGFLWSSLLDLIDDGLVKALEAWLLCAEGPLP